MTNNLRTAFGGLVTSAVLAATALGGDTNSIPTFISYGLISKDNAQQMQLVALLPAGDTNHYTLQTSTNLLSSVWQDSASNTNVYSTSATKKQEKTLFEPYNPEKKTCFYRLKSN